MPADVYDTLEFSALVYGGIGAGWLIYLDEPCCPIGQLMAAGVNIELPDQYGDYPFFGFTARKSDDAVMRANKKLGRVLPDKPRCGTWGRVPFQAWCAELGVTRGDG